MSVKVKFRGNGKATVKFGNPAEEAWFKTRMAVIRDSDSKTHPQMIVRDEKGVHLPKTKPIGLPPKPLKLDVVKPTTGLSKPIVPGGEIINATGVEGLPKKPEKQVTGEVKK